MMVMDGLDLHTCTWHGWMYLFGFVVIVGVMSTLCMMSYVHVYYDLSVLTPLFLCVVRGYVDGVQMLGVDLI